MQVGEKIIVKIQEFLQKGYIEEARQSVLLQHLPERHLLVDPPQATFSATKSTRISSCSKQSTAPARPAFSRLDPTRVY